MMLNIKISNSFKGSCELPFNILKRNFIIIIWKLAIKSPSRREFSSTHAYVHLLADVHLTGFAPAFTLSQCDSEYARKPQDAHSLGRYG